MNSRTLPFRFLAALFLFACAQRGTSDGGPSSDHTSSGTSTGSGNPTSSTSTTETSSAADTTAGSDSSTSPTDTDGDPCTILDGCDPHDLCGCSTQLSCAFIEIEVPDDCSEPAWEVSGDTMCTLSALAQGTVTTVGYIRGFPTSDFGCGAVETYIRILEDRKAVVRVRHDGLGRGGEPPDPPPAHRTLRPPDYFEACLASSDPEFIAQCFIDPFEGPPVCAEPAC